MLGGNMKKSLLSLLLCTMLMAGCVGVTPVLPAYTGTPTLTATPSRSPVHTKIPTLKITLTPQPTLSFDLPQQFYDLLANNGGCTLPCFLGITPGQSTWEDASRILEKYRTNNKPVESYKDDKGIETRYLQIIATKDTTLMVDIKIHTDENNIIQDMILGLDAIQNGFRVKNEPRFSRYSLREVSKSLGLPDAIYVTVYQFSGSAELYVVYENKKVVTFFFATTKKEGENDLSLCPLDANQISLTTVLSDPSKAGDVRKLFPYPFYSKSDPQRFEYLQLSSTEIQNLFDAIQKDTHPCIELHRDG
jgi:hypothetical protein